MSDISVIIPVYNGAPYLAEAIASVLEQTCTPMELIVVDDGSTDDTAQVAQRFPEVHYAYQPNAGQAAAINRGVRLSTGRLLAFLDADDLWVENKLALQLAALEADPELDIVFGLAQQFAEPGACNVVLPTQQILPAYLPSAMLIRRHAFEHIGEFDACLKIAEAVDWYSRALTTGLKQQTLNQVVYKRRIHGDNITIRQPRQLHQEYLAVIKTSLDRRRRC